MAHKPKKKKEEEMAVNMTPMIDIVFQMIIFFVCTVQLEKDQLNESIKLAMAPNGPAVEQKDPRTVHVDVTDDGRIWIGHRLLPPSTLRAVIKKAVQEYGQGVPVVIRGSSQTKHSDIKRVMDICTGVGLWKVKFAAIKDKVN